MPKHSEERQKAELGKLLREIARDLEAGILATNLPAPFKKARDLATALDRGHKVIRGVYAKDDPAVKYFKKRFGVDFTGAPFVGDSFNPMPPDPQSARVRAVNMLLWRFQERAMCGQKAEADDLAKLLTLADSLDGGKALARRHRRPPLTPKARPLTARQAEVMQIVAECKGDLAEAARRLGIDRKTLKESYDAANRKLGIRVMPKAKTVALPVDRRGEVTVTKDRRK